jgi:hypothetical protein
MHPDPRDVRLRRTAITARHRTEVVHHNRIVGVERGPGLTRLRA